MTNTISVDETIKLIFARLDEIGKDIKDINDMLDLFEDSQKKHGPHNQGLGKK